MPSPLTPSQVYPNANNTANHYGSINAPNNAEAANAASLYGDANTALYGLENAAAYLAALTLGPAGAPPNAQPPAIPASGTGLGSGPNRLYTLATAYTAPPLTDLRSTYGNFADTVAVLFFGVYQVFPGLGLSDDGLYRLDIATGSIPAWGSGNLYVQGQYRTDGGNLYVCSTGGHVAALPGPAAGGGTDGGGNVWTLQSHNPQWTKVDADLFTGSSAGSSSAGLVPKLGAAGLLDPSFIPQAAPTSPPTIASSTPTLLSTIGFATGWSSPNGDAAFWKDAVGMVHFKGTLAAGASVTSTVLSAALPSGYKPKYKRGWVIMYDSGGGLFACMPTIDNSGNFTIQGGSEPISGHTYYLDGISYLGEQ